ncbi:MAG TPA: hypothetical protein VK489_06980 [Ferruginibacter sp.]|nr:hypothetical protein [Ferruginibacter sp.]
MKNLLIFIFILNSIPAFSQADTTAPYLKTRSLPNFSLLTTDSVAFSQNILDNTKNTIIMLFNPECEHCQEQLELLLSMPALLQTTQIVLSSIETHEKNRIFYNKFHLEKYPSVYLGKDHKYFFGGYFRPKTIPVLALYDKQRHLLLLNQGNMKKKQIEKALKL